MINDFVLIAMLLSKVSQPSHLKIVDTKNEMKVEKCKLFLENSSSILNLLF